MSVEVERLRRVKIQTESTFGTAPANFNSAYNPRMRAVPTLRRMSEILPDETIQQFSDANPFGVIGFKRSTLTLPCYLDSHGTPLSGSQAWAHYWLSILLQHVMGGLDAVTNMGTTTSSGWTTTSGDVGSASNLERGNGVGITPGASGLYQIRRIVEKSTNTLTTNIAFSTAPLNTNVLYGCATAYLADNPTATLQAACLGAESDDQWLALGLAGNGMTLTFERGRLAGIDFNLQGCTWDDHSGETFADSGISYGSGNRTVVKDSELLVVASAQAQARATLDVAEIRIEPSIVYEEIPSTAGIQGIVGYRRIPQRPAIKGSFLQPFQAKTFSQARDNRTAYQVLFQIGNAAGHSVAIDIPRVQIVDVEDAPQGRKRGQRVMFQNDHDSVTTWTSATSPTEQERSAYRIFLG